MNKEEPIYISAYANEGYEFVSWSNGSTDSTIELDITNPIELVATFKEVVEETNEEESTEENISEDDFSSTLYMLDRKDYRPLNHMSI